jgi:ubiquinone/menaquinone biosynthesis C-methylase UbiE
MNRDEKRNDKETLQAIQEYWNRRIHDLEVVTHPVGTLGFFRDLDEYRFDKLRYLPRVVDFNAFQNKKVLEIGCGAGIDLVRFAQGGALVTGVDLSQTAIDLAKKNFELRELKGDMRVMNGQALEFQDNTFDVVYVHGVLQYTADPWKMAEESCRVLKPGGLFIGMVYNRRGWLNIMSRFFKVELEHEDAPVLEKYTIREFRNMLAPFSRVKIVPERFPVKSRLHKGVKGFLFNTFFVGGFNLIPRPLVRRTGWHLMAFAEKE